MELLQFNITMYRIYWKSRILSNSISRRMIRILKIITLNPSDENEWAIIIYISYNKSIFYCLERYLIPM